MIIINGKKFATNKAEFAKSLFSDQTCTGFYKKLKKGVRLSDHQGTVFAFIYDNGRSDRGIVSCRAEGNQYRYLSSTMNIDEKLLGFDNGLKYGKNVELAEKVLNELYPDKYAVYIL